MLNNELWLRRSMRFDVLLDSENGSGAAWRCEVSPSEKPPAQVVKWPADLMLYGLSGRGILEAETGERMSLGPAACVRIRKNQRVFLRNELRDIWRFLAILQGDTGAESFIDALAFTTDESELAAQAAAVGCELYLPEREPELPPAIVALENRIAYPMHLNFSL